MFSKPRSENTPPTIDELTPPAVQALGRQFLWRNPCLGKCMARCLHMRSCKPHPPPCARSKMDGCNQHKVFQYVWRVFFVGCTHQDAIFSSKMSFLQLYFLFGPNGMDGSQPQTEENGFQVWLDPPPTFFGSRNLMVLFPSKKTTWKNSGIVWKTRGVLKQGGQFTNWRMVFFPPKLNQSLSFEAFFSCGQFLRFSW